MVLDTMSMEQIALAAECITMARIEFVEEVLIDPIITVLGGKIEKSSRTAAGEHRRKRKSKRTPEERDARLMNSATLLGFPIVDAGPGYR